MGAVGVEGAVVAVAEVGAIGVDDVAVGGDGVDDVVMVDDEDTR